ncbi:MAG: SDR family oxidoreductase [Chrysiogenetes bacterium]|nr:SDR family oxidoreductase [Chrysiogenetes bacterium]
MEQTHAGRVALVTGTSRGIGRAIARHLVARGARVFGTGRDKAALARLADELNAKETRFVFAHGDLSDAAFCESLPWQCVDDLGALDILINNAGINQVARIEDLELEQWEELLRVNLTAPFILTKAAWPHLRKSKHAIIVNVSSVSAMVGLPKFPGFAGYCASKYGLQGLTDVSCAEGKADGIRVVAVQPGSTDTDMLRDSLPDAQPQLAPEDVADVVGYLTSDAARKVNGATIEIFP